MPIQMFPVSTLACRVIWTGYVMSQGCHICETTIKIVLEERTLHKRLFYQKHIQSTLAISTSVISNNWLSRSEILVPVLI